MFLATLCSTLLLAPALGQTIDGIKPVDDAAPKFAKAYVTEITENKSLETTPDYFATAYFSMKAKTLASLVNTKYTAAHMGLCGTVLGLYDAKLAAAIKAASDRITKGDKDFDSPTKEELDAIQKATVAEDSPLFIVLKPNISKETMWSYFSGSQVGLLAAYVNAWHISPKQPILLKWIGEGAEGCADQGSKPEASSRKELADALKGFAKFKGKTMDEATVREIGKQIEVVLKASLPEKYRWQ